MKSVLCVLLFVSAMALAQSNPVPFINQPLVPTSTVPGGPAFTLTVNGTGFVSGAVVNWNGSALTTTFVNGSQVTAIVPASDIANAGTVSVTVTNPAPGGGTSNVQFFDVHAPITLAFTNYLAPSTISGQGIITADFNRDGKPDLAYWSNNNVFIQLGNGNFTFQPAVSYAVGNSTYFPFQDGIVTGDFNGDGKLDLGVVNVNDSTVSILLGNGDGTFQPQVTFATGSGPGALAVGDFNGDGKLDLAVPFAGQGNNDGGVSVLLGNGDGTFQTRVDYGTSTEPYAILTGDFNRDGKLDLVILDCSDSVYICTVSVSVLLGNGDGTFQSAYNVASFDNNFYADFLLSADLNADDKLDLVVADIGDGAGHGASYVAAVFLGNGDGTFQSPVYYDNQFGNFDGGIGGVALGDFNADAKLDFAYSNTLGAYGDPGSLTILPGNGDGTFQTGVNFPALSSAYDIVGLAVGDFNGNGTMDFVTDPNNSTTPFFLGGQYPVAGLSTNSLSGLVLNVGSSESLGT